MAKKTRTATVAYEDPKDNYDARVRSILAELGSADPDGDMARAKDYLTRAKAAGIDPQVAANTVFLFGGAGEAPRKDGLPRGEYKLDPQGLGKLHHDLNAGKVEGSRVVVKESAWGAEERPSRPGYYAVDPSGRIVAGPFASRHGADDHARRVNGYVQFEAGESAADCEHTHPEGVPTEPCAAAAECGCKHTEPLKRPLRWHRRGEGKYYAPSPLGEFRVEQQKSNLRQDIAGWSLKLEEFEIRSFASAGEGKAYAQSYGEIAPVAAAGEPVMFENAGKRSARPVVGGKPLAEACVPWVRVTRDPEKFQTCLALAKTIGPVDDAKKVHEIVGPYLETEDQEVFLVILTDVRDQLRGVTEVARGQRSRVAVDVADVIRPVIVTGASNFWVWHGHPSGDPEPSGLDRRLTKQIAAAAKAACPDVKFRGHGVSGGKNYRMA